MKRLLETAKAKTVVNLLVLCAVAVFILPGAAQASGLVDQDYLDSIVDTNPNPVPHWASPEDEAYIQQLIVQRAMLPMVEPLAAPTGVIWTPAEYEACMGPLVAWEPGNYLALLTEFVVGVTTDASGSIAYVIVRDASQEASATTTLSGAGANMSRVEFIYYNLNTVWIRDYGPRYILVDGMPVIIDHTYNRARAADNAFPDSVDDMAVPFEQDEPVYLMDLTHGGGNFHAFSNGDAFMSTLILDENSGKSQSAIETIIEDHHNVNVTIYDRLISNVDYTGHIDMWFLPVGDNKVIISEFPTSGYPLSRATTEDAAADSTSRGYTVYRVPAYNSTGEGSSGGTHYTYTNASIINDRVYVPEYGHASDDATALAVFQAAMPDHEIIQVDCASIISAAGAIHCVMKHVYEPLPTPPTIVSTPVTNAGVGFLYSYDVDASGYPASTYSLETYPAGMTIDSSTGLIEWTPGSTGDFDVVVRATNSEGFDEQSFTLSVEVMTEIVYDFSSSAGTIHHAYGTYSDTWSDLNGYRTHAEFDTEVTAVASDAYDDLAYSDATGGDSDPGRYQNPDEGYGDESTMTCEFYISEDRTEVTQLDVLWEGYGDASRHMELYIWNYAQGNWGNLNGNTGENNFVDDGTASDTDVILQGSTTSNITDYIDTDGEITLLIYMDTSSEDSLHDYVSVTVYTASAPPPEYTLTVNTVGNGSVTKDPNQTTYTSGIEVELTANPDTGYHFVEWSGDLTGSTNPDTITMDSNKSVTANFAVDTFTLDYAAGAGGILTGDVAQVVDYNTDGTAVTAVPDTGYHFVDWSDASTVNPRTDTSVTANINVTANFAIDQMVIFGYITEPDANIPVEGGFIGANNGGSSDITDANGYYQLTVDYGWSGTVEPNKTGCTFEPNGIEYNNVTADQNDSYIAILDTFIIYGYAVDSEMLTPLAGVLVSPDNNGGPFTSKYYGGGSYTTEADGYYEVLVDYNFSGKVVPSMYAYVFEPNSMTYTDVTEDREAMQDYVGTLLTYTITGYILNYYDIPIEGVSVNADNGGGSDVTDVDGFYEVWVDYNWSGTVTPTKKNYTFDPNWMPYSDVLEDWIGDYIATNIYDLDCDGSIGLGDVMIISENWLGGPDLPGDFYEDEDDIVNFLDFAEFANVWGD